MNIICLVLPCPTSSDDSVEDLRTGGGWFKQYSFQRLMIVTVIGLFLSHHCLLFFMVMWESSLWLGENVVRSTG